MRERPPGSGHWQLRVFVGPDPVTGRPIQATRTFVGGKRAAGKALAGLVTEVESGTFDRTRATVAQLLDKWLEQIELTRRPKTVAEYRAKIDKRVRPPRHPVDRAQPGGQVGVDRPLPSRPRFGAAAAPGADEDSHAGRAQQTSPQRS